MTFKFDSSLSYSICCYEIVLEVNIILLWWLLGIAAGEHRFFYPLCNSLCRGFSFENLGQTNLKVCHMKGKT